MKRIDPVERQLFLEGLFLKYGYDFRQYAESSMNRRLEMILQKNETDSLLSLLERALRDRVFFHQLLPLFTISTTEFFRDPLFFKALRQKVIPLLKTYPALNVWIAGCSTGEELYSLAILLKEEGLLERTTLFATDISAGSLKVAREGIYGLPTMRHFSRQYLAAGGQRSPADYYVAEFDMARIDSSLRENIVFSEHNLATDAVFAEMQLILCRNVLIYFSRELQDRALDLFVRSLTYRGFLGIGSKEAVRFSKAAPLFESVDSSQNIFRLKGAA